MVVEKRSLHDEEPESLSSQSKAVKSVADIAVSSTNQVSSASDDEMEFEDIYEDEIEDEEVIDGDDSLMQQEDQEMKEDETRVRYYHIYS
jgi:hypothetical protein